jgi:hypothetical protein
MLSIYEKRSVLVGDNTDHGQQGKLMTEASVAEILKDIEALQKEIDPTIFVRTNCLDVGVITDIVPIQLSYLHTTQTGLNLCWLVTTPTMSKKMK